MIDLWPEDITYTKTRAPVNILREQAALLGAKTQNIVKAEVVNMGINMGSTTYVIKSNSNAFRYGFFLIAPVLDNYRYLLFTITNDVLLYPATIFLHDELGTEHQAHSESEFLEHLKDIFESERTRQVIHAMLIQSEGVEVTL